MEHKPNFWATLPGILTGLAALVTAATGLYVAVRGDAPEPTQPTQQTVATDGNGMQQANPVTAPAPNPLAPTTSPQVGASASTQPPTDPVVPRTDGATPSPLVDCTQPAFQLSNTVRSLMSWSDYYHGQIPTNGASRAGASHPCQKALAYRGSAHCQQPQDMAIRQALFETLSLCRAAGVDLDNLPAQ